MRVGEFFQFVDERQAVSKWATKDDLRWGEMTAWVGGVAEL